MHVREPDEPSEWEPDDSDWVDPPPLPAGAPQPHRFRSGGTLVGGAAGALLGGVNNLQEGQGAISAVLGAIFVGLILAGIGAMAGIVMDRAASSHNG